MTLDPNEAIHVAAPAGFRRVTLLVAIAVIGLEFWAFWIAARLTALLQRAGTGDQDLQVFVVFWTALTVQAMLVTGCAWTLVALARTTVRGHADGLEVAHPWRRWSGRWADLAEAYRTPGWLHLRPERAWRTWHVRVSADSEPQVDAVRRAVPAGRWLEPDAARMRLARRMLPAIVVATLIGGGSILALQQWIARLLPR